MSFRSRLAGLLGGELRGNPLDNPNIPIGQAAVLFDFGAPTSAGVSVTAKTAMQHTTVYACINVLASDFSSLPCLVLERTPAGLKPAVDTDLYYLLAVEPNPEMSAVAFWGALMASAALRGNGYAEIQWDPDAPNVPIALWPWSPESVTPKRTASNEFVYEIRTGANVRVLKSKDMLHITALTLDGWLGIDPLTAARQAVGTAIAASKYIGGFFGRGSRPSGILTRAVPAAQGGTLAAAKAESSDSTRESWERANSGDNQGRTAVLPPGWEWKPISITPEQAQQLQVMQYTRTDLCGMWQVPPHRVGDTSRLSNSNHESSALEYITFTQRPWIVRFEAEIQRKLMPRIGRKANKYLVRFDTTEFTRGDFASQMTGFAIGKQWGFYNTNDIRAKLGENPIAGPAGNEYLVPLNMVPASRILDEPEPDPNADPANPPEPKGNGGRNQRMLLGRIATAFGPLYRDAAGRLCAREKRDSAAVQATFGAVLQAIADESSRQARELNRLPAEVDLGAEKLVREAAKVIEKRAANWNFETIETDALEELQRSVRSITLNIFREAGAHLAEAA